MSANLKKKFPPSYNILKFKDLWANSVDPDEVAHHEPPYPDLHCLQIVLFLFLVLSRSPKLDFIFIQVNKIV